MWGLPDGHTTSFYDGQNTLSYKMKGYADNKGVFYPTSPQISGNQSTGTTVSIFEPHEEFTIRKMLK